MISLLLLAIFTMGSVFAGDCDNETLTQDKNDNIADGDILKESVPPDSFSSLADSIENTNDSKITLTHDYLFNSSVDGKYLKGININKTITLDGAGFRINANYSARIFNVTASDVILKNIVFTNGNLSDESGGGSILWIGDNARLINCTFTNSFSKNGGAIRFLGNNATIDGCKFSNNSGNDSGGAIHFSSESGIINNSYFYLNHVKTEGGCIYSSNKKLNITHCIFENNYVDWLSTGGAMQFKGDLNNQATLINCSFKSNAAGNGTNIYSQITLIILNSTFKDTLNTTSITTTSDLYLSNNTFNKNNSIYVDNGKITSPTSVMILNGTTIILDAGDNITLYGVIHDDRNNTIIFNSIDFTVNNNEIIPATFNSNGTFKANYTIKKGIYTISANITDKLSDATIHSLKIVDRETDKALRSTSFSELAKLILNSTDSVTLTHNYLYNSTLDGNYSNGIRINKSIVIDGAGFVIDANFSARIFNITAGNVIIKNITLTKANISTESGGAIIWIGDNGSFSDSKITDSYALNGGAIYAFNNTLNITNSIFESNYAYLNGGAISFEDVEARINNTLFKDNYLIWYCGGAIEFRGNSTKLSAISNCRFESNLAITGTSIYAETPLIIKNSTFSDVTNSKSVITTSELYLSQNTLNKNNTVYVDGGKITSPTNVYILNGSSIKVNLAEEIILSGIIYDDKNNTIILKSIDFTTNNETIPAEFDLFGVFRANYTIFDEKSYIISVNITDKLSDAIIHTANITGKKHVNISINVIYCVDPLAVFGISSPVDGIYNVSVNGQNLTINITNGVSYLTLTLNPGDYNIFVSYDGDKDNSRSNKSLEFTVFEDKLISTITITLIHGNYTVEGVLKDNFGNGIENAEIKYSIDDANNLTTTTHSNGIFHFNAGKNALVNLYYDGNATIWPTMTNITLNEIEPYRRNTTLNLTYSEYSFGSDVVVSVKTDNLTGNITFIIDGISKFVSLENGTANYTISNISAGNHSIIAVYSGDETHNSTYNSTTLFVKVYESKIENITLYANFTITARLTDSQNPIANATIIYSINNVNYTTTTDNEGVFSIQAVNGYGVDIIFNGKDNFLKTNTSITLSDLSYIKVPCQFDVGLGSVITTYAVDYAAGERHTTYSFKLSDLNGNAVKNANVLVAYNGAYLNKVSDENGIITVDITGLSAEDYLCALTYLGGDKTAAASTALTFKILKKPITISASAKKYKASVKTKKYTVTIKTQKCASGDGKIYLKSGKKLTLKIKGKTYTAKSNSKGQVTFKIKLTKRGKYSAVINFAGDNIYNSASKKVKITLK